jgi:phosphomannomutase
VHVDEIRSKSFHVIVDCVNSTGAMSIPPLLDALGCTYTLLNPEVTGRFAHNPEPLASNLSGLMSAVRGENAAMGIAVDPDVDRLAFVSEDGTYFGEEYTLVSIADYILKHTPGNTVSNLSSTRALRDITEKHGGRYSASPVGEVHVVSEMKSQNAVIGGEGNGGIIYPPLHYGRDALVGIALMLSQLAKTSMSMTELRSSYPDYTIVKDKIQLDGLDPDSALSKVKSSFGNQEIDTRDGVKVLFDESWVHLRKSNTEPIVRVYAEHKSKEQAANLVAKVKSITLG